MTDDIILPPNPSRVMEGLRDTGYDFNTAIADIIDNSIAASAKRVSIQIGFDCDHNLFVYIADDGIGMNFDELKNAMTYGSAERDDAASLGKFGLGLKTASTAFCRCLSVVSRGKDNIIRKVQWDLDYISEINQWKLRCPDVDFDEQDFLDATCSGHTGTLVEWQKIDKLFGRGDSKNVNKSLKKVIDSLKFHISLVYQRFLDNEDTRAPNVTIDLNGESICAWNPFFPKETNTTVLYDRPIRIEDDKGNCADLIVRAFLLPRAEDFSSMDVAKSARISNDMQGFYTYRENRLIHYGDWMGMYQNEPHGSLLRVEISFDNRLDSAFHVDIKKSRILLDEAIFIYIKDQILPPLRREADSRYRMGVNKKVKEGSKSIHDASNRNIGAKAPSLESSHVEVIDKDNGKVKIVGSNGTYVTHRISIQDPIKPGQNRVIPADSLENGVLWRPGIVDGCQAVQINTSHPFYQKIYYPLKENRVFISGLDSLFWALTAAEISRMGSDEELEMYEDMRILVSRNLKKLLNDLPEPTFKDDKDE